MTTTNTPDVKTDELEVLVTDEEALAYLKEHGSTRLNQQMEQSVVTPIELAKALDIRPQMIYNYIRDGRIASRKTPDTQKIVIPLEVAQAYVATRLNKDAAKAKVVQAQLESAAKANV